MEVPGLRVTTGSIAGASLWGFSDLALDLDRVELAIARAPRGALLPDLLPPGALAIVNGGYFEQDFRPSTWLKSGGQELAPKVDTSRGGLLAVAAGRSYLGAFSGLGFEPELAVQSFPLIVEADAKPGIHRDDGRRAARTVVCSKDAGHRSGRPPFVGALHFVVIAAPRGEGPTLFEADELLRRPAPAGFGCQVALNLDGGPSSGVAFGPAVAAKQRLPIAPVAYGITLRSR